MAAIFKSLYCYFLLSVNVMSKMQVHQQCIYGVTT